MLKISNLIQKVDHFYNTAISEYNFSKLAAEPSPAWSMPDDDEDEGPKTDRAGGDNSVPQKNYDNIMFLLNGIRNSEIRENGLVLANMYLEAIRLNDGFNAIDKGISNFINIFSENSDADITEEEEEAEDELKDLFIEIADQISTLKKDKDSDEAIAALRESRRAYTPDALNEIISETAPSVGDRTGGLSRDQNQGFGHGGQAKTDYSIRYANELSYYTKQLSKETNPSNRASITKIIDTLKQLVSVATDLHKFQDEAKENPSDTNAVAALQASKDKIKKLRSNKTAFKMQLRKDLLLKQKDNFLNKFKEIENYNPTPIPEIENNPALLAKNYNRSKYIAYQTLKLNEGLLSQDKNKANTNVLRKLLISHVSKMTSGSPKEVERFVQLKKVVDDAVKGIIPIAVWNKMEAKRTALNMQKVPIPEELQKARERSGLARYKTDHFQGARDWANITLSGYVENLSKAMLAERKTAKDRLVGSKNRKVAEEKKVKFKPYLDAIADASKNHDSGKIKMAISALRAAIKQEVQFLPEFSQFVISVRLSKSWHQFKDALVSLNKMHVEEKQQFSASEITAIKQVIAMGQKLAEYFGTLEVKQIGPRGTNTKGPSGDPHNNPYATQINIAINATLYLTNILRSVNTEEEPTPSINQGEKDVGPEKIDETTGLILKRKIDPQTGVISYEEEEEFYE